MKRSILTNLTNTESASDAGVIFRGQGLGILKDEKAWHQVLMCIFGKGFGWRNVIVKVDVTKHFYHLLKSKVCPDLSYCYAT